MCTSAVPGETGFTVNYPLQKEQCKLWASFPWDMEAGGLPSSEQILVLCLGCICMTLISFCLYSVQI